MKNNWKSLKILFAALILSYTSYSRNLTFGTYGVSEKDPSDIQLTINSDHTFFYQDFSDPSNKISVHGEWRESGSKIILKGDKNEKGFHRVWTFHQNGNVAKSRKGLSFYRLCKID
ncbi:MAG TPA: hypothetical protein PKL85_03565 [Bacteroidia bacterium]|nr:hypothetical protein [Bacteroidia bacterium]